MSVEENKRIAAKYHELDANDADEILTEDFIGRHAQNRHTWNRESHRQFLSNHPEMVDTVESQIGEGDLVATRFTRTMTYQGRDVKVEATHFKRFKEGKIAEIWEHFDWRQLEPE